MSDHSIQYSNYSWDELMDARDHIDRVRYPGNAAALDEEISARRQGSAPGSATLTVAPSMPNPTVAPSAPSRPALIGGRTLAAIHLTTVLLVFAATISEHMTRRADSGVSDWWMLVMIIDAPVFLACVLIAFLGVLFGIGSTGSPYPWWLENLSYLAVFGFFGTAMWYWIGRASGALIYSSWELLRHLTSRFTRRATRAGERRR